MTVSLNHAIVFAEDKDESASFFTRLFALPEAESWGPFRIVALVNEGSVLFAEPGIEIQPQHLAFLVSEEDFDGIYGRIVEGGIEHWGDPRKSAPGTVNTNNGGEGCTSTTRPDTTSRSPPAREGRDAGSARGRWCPPVRGPRESGGKDEDDTLREPRRLRGARVG